ncbi:transposase [Deinococcus yavapaiensis KR-236]|uniref:Transposase n=1 Tax=Deinococcus yavapaiensis KR-236 TaxID=694435 RepID=A0A318SE15_9DEIO|nr:transposase [Deinococcus yavapaiensis KR-236]
MQWSNIVAFLPPQRSFKGRPPHDHRRILNGILWVLRTGAPWRDLPERYGKWNSVYVRFRRWTQCGIWQRLLHALQRDADLQGRLDWKTHFVDGTVIRAHPCAAGAHGEQALGRSRGGFSTKLHLRAEGNGKPMAFVLSGGERHEAKFLESLLDLGKVKRAGRGRPRSKSAVLVGDRGYSYPSLRRLLSKRNIKAVIPTRRDQPCSFTFDAFVYRERNKIERLVGRLKRHRRIATRYDKLAVIFEAWVTIACILEWLLDVVAFHISNHRCGPVTSTTA